MRRLRRLGLCLPAFWLVACGSGSGDGDEAAQALAGNWATGCYADAESGSDPENYKRDELAVAGSTIVTTMIFFQKTDASCATPIYDFVTTATFALGGEVDELPGAKKIDLKPAKFEIKPETADTAAVFNRQQPSYCGFSDWAAGTTRDVTGKSCVGSLDTVYDIYRLSGAELSFGYVDGDEDGSAPDMRPKTLDTLRVYKKSDASS